MNIKDKEILRDLAKRVAEIAHLPEQEKKKEMWFRHNRLERVKPMVLIFPEGSWRELIDEKEIKTSDAFSRRYELELRRILYYGEYLKDDNVIEDTITCPVVMHDRGWTEEGMQKVITPEESYGANRYETAIMEESDIYKIQKPDVRVDWKTTEENYQKAIDIFGDILTVEKRGVTIVDFSMMDALAGLRGFDRLFLDLVERPNWVHRAMNILSESFLSRLEQLESQNALSLNNRNHYVGSGGVGYTDELPQPDFNGSHVRPIDMWGHGATQIFSDVSPDMHEEFALQYEKRFQEKFGLNCYGCCEPLHKKLDIVKTIPRLRRISMSPWVDVKEAASGIQDKYIFSYKPHPTPIAAEHWDPELARRHLQDVLTKTKDCVIEIIMKDTHTCRNQPQRLWEWVEIAKQTAEEFA